MLLPTAGIEPGPPEQQAIAQSITTLPLGPRDALELPLFDLHSRSMPFRLRAIRANSTKLSEMLKLTSGDTSKNPIEFLSA